MTGRAFQSEQYFFATAGYLSWHHTFWFRFSFEIKFFNSYFLWLKLLTGRATVREAHCCLESRTRHGVLSAFISLLFLCWVFTKKLHDHLVTFLASVRLCLSAGCGELKLSKGLVMTGHIGFLWSSVFSEVYDIHSNNSFFVTSLWVSKLHSLVVSPRDFSVEISASHVILPMFTWLYMSFLLWQFLR